MIGVVCAYCRRPRRDESSTCPGCGAGELLSISGDAGRPHLRRFYLMPPSPLFDPEDGGVLRKLSERMKQFNEALR